MRVKHLKSVISTLLIVSLGFSLLFISTEQVRAQEIEWVRQFGTSTWDYVTDVAVDVSGNVYIVGYTYGALPGQISLGDADAFVRKYDASGNELWTRQFGTSSEDHAEGVAVDVSGNVYIVGYTKGMFPGQTYSGNVDAFVRKYDASGNALWTRQFGTSSEDHAEGVAVDVSGNVYIVGYTYGALPGQISLGDADAFVRKYDASGNELWTRQFGTSTCDDAWDVAVDVSGNVYAIGDTYGVFPGQTSYGGKDMFVRKYDVSGNALWTRQFGTSSEDHAEGVAVDALSNVYVVGEIFEVSGGAWADIDVFVKKYDVSGNELWTRQFGTSDWDFVSGVAVDALGNAYVAGEVSEALPGQTSYGGKDVFVRKYDVSGNALWTRQFGTPDWEYAMGVAVDVSGNIYVGGEEWGALPEQINLGETDAFLVKFSQEFLVPATVDIEPNTIDLSRVFPMWITAYIELPPGYEVRNIDASTVRLIIGEGEVPAKLNSAKIGDYDRDGIPDLMVKFNKRAVQALLSVGEYEAKVVGKVAGASFEGKDTIHVINSGRMVAVLYGPA